MSRRSNTGDVASGSGERGGQARVWATRIGFLLLSTIVAFELMAQLYARHVLSQLEQMKSRPDHYFTLSRNEVLGYELARGKTVVKYDRSLGINRYGIRDKNDDLATKRLRIGLLGASVVFGDRFDTRETISAFLQTDLDSAQSRVKVLNLAVPGYNLEEHIENLRVMDPIYDLHHVVFILNAVDFARRNSRYEGGDNGLYRMYHAPRFAGLWLLRKAIYRYRKGGLLWNPNLVSVGWYKWLYRGNRGWGLDTIGVMDAYCRERGCRFTLLPLPPGSAYVDGRFLLADEYAEIFDYAENNGVDVIRSIEEFDASVFDSTDHLNIDGNRRVARILARHLRPMIIDGLPGVPTARTTGNGDRDSRR